MRSLLLCLFVLSINLAYSQKPHVQKYHELVNKAEILICRDSGEYALPLYKEAFELLDKPFTKDLCNYFRQGLIFADSAAIDYCIPKLQQRGYTTKSLIRIGKLKPYKGSDYWLAQIPQYHEVYNYDTAYANFIKDLIRTDQEVRFRNPESSDYTARVLATDSANAVRFGKYIMEHGFLTDDRVFQGWQDVYLILHHYRLHDWGIPLDSILLANVYNGNLHPHYYAMLNDGSYTMFEPNTAMDELVVIKPKGLYFGSNRLYYAKTKENQLIDEEPEKFDWTVHIIPFTIGEAKQMNEARKLIYIEPIEETIEKAQYSKSLSTPFSYMIIPIIPIEEF